jgi:hypothetical protein
MTTEQVESRAESRERVGVVAGYRPCIKCGFALEGQPVEREPHYRLLMIFCPECGAPSPVQEYPVLGSWGRRLGVLCLAVWVILLLGAFAGYVGGQVGIVAGFMESARRANADAIALEHLDWFRSSGEAERLAALQNPPAGYNAAQFVATIQGGNFFSPINVEWWNTTGKAAFEPLHWRDASSMMSFVGLGLFAGVGGAFFAAALPGARGWRRFLMPMLASGFVAAFTVWVLHEMTSKWTWGWYVTSPADYGTSAIIAAADACPNSLSYVAVAFAAACGCVGAVIGRPMSRFIAGLLVAPSKLHLLEFLWSADGKKLPGRR